MQLEIGDFDKFLDNSSIEEIHNVAEFYQVIGFSDFAFKILNAAKGDEEIDAVELDFQISKLSLQNCKVDYIRRNAEIFQLN